MAEAAISIWPLSQMGEVACGDDLAELIVAALLAADLRLEHGDFVVVAQKIVSKAEGRRVALSEVEVTDAALKLAEESGKPAALCQLILSESDEVMRVRQDLVIVRHRLGHVGANAGIDHSNVTPLPGGAVLLLPIDPDASATRLRGALRRRTGIEVAILIIDSVGRAWRMGTVGTAIGIAGMPGLVDLRGRADRHGRELEASEVGFADEVASAASLVMGQADEGRPVAIVRGLHCPVRQGSAGELLRPRPQDLFP
jgi:coenzyme F420-0:L-glutamate ligase/coenzyme F420-1:gamma-L-glutamate ligase